MPPATPGFLRLFPTILLMTSIATASEPQFRNIGGTFEGWQQSGNWLLEDGAFHRASKGGSLVYVTEEVPDDFELRFEWKVGNRSNSGVYYAPGQIEYQILDNTEHPDGQHPRTSAASLYFGIAPSEDNTKPVGEWNRGRIVRKGTVIQHWLNGVAVVDIDYADPRWAEDMARLKNRGGDPSKRGGKFSLQDHGDPVWFRNMRLREIPADEAVVANSDFVQQAITDEQLAKEKAKLERIMKNRKK